MKNNNAQDMAAMGRLGGNATKAKHGRAHYERAGSKGARAMKALLERGKLLEALDAKKSHE